MARPCFEERRPMTLQLLRDRGAKFSGSSFLINFEEKGPHTGEHWVFNAEMIKQAFGEPKDPDDPDSQYIENLRAATHVLLEKRMLELRRISYPIYKSLNEVFPLDGSADSDYEYYYSKLDSDHIPTRIDTLRLLTRVEMGIDNLTRLMLDDDLVVEFARVRTIREQRLKEARDQRVVDEYEVARSSGKREKAAAFEVATSNGLSTSTVRLLVEQARLARGEEKRKRGRPKKKGA